MWQDRIGTSEAAHGFLTQTFCTRYKDFNACLPRSQAAMNAMGRCSIVKLSFGISIEGAVRASRARYRELPLRRSRLSTSVGRMPQHGQDGPGNQGAFWKPYRGPLRKQQLAKSHSGRSGLPVRCLYSGLVRIRSVQLDRLVLAEVGQWSL